MRSTQKFKAAVAVAVAACLSAVPSAADASTITCSGTTVVTGASNFTTHGSNGATVTQMDIVGVHDLCLADGTLVSATLAGTLMQVTRPDGTSLVVVNETLSVGDGTAKATVRASVSPTGFDATVHVFGGTGTLKGVSGRGTTAPTGPGTFVSQIEYQYR